MSHDLHQTDGQQRKQALDISQSFIVQAPAGSGKTELLIQRFLMLLIKVNYPEEILAITFTKKAANEMRGRLIKALKQGLSAEPHEAYTKKTWRLARQVLARSEQQHWHLMDNPNQLRIQTIDSFCTHLTKQLPLLSHFGAPPAIAEHPLFLYREAVTETLSHIEETVEWAKAIAHLLLHLNNDLEKLSELLMNLLAKRDQWLPYIHFDLSSNEIRKQLEHQLELIHHEALKKIITLFPAHLTQESMAIARFAAHHLVDSEIAACRDLHALPSACIEDKKAWLGLVKLFLTQDGRWRQTVTKKDGFPSSTDSKNAQEKKLNAEYKERFSALMVLLQEYDDLRIALSALPLLPHPCYTEEQWYLLQSLLRVLKVSVAQLRLIFQRYGQIDYIENMQAALTALGDDGAPTDLALALDYQIRHLLIDEFQDTSTTQYQLLEKLTLGWETHDGRTLFVVGDPMQSIYRFREAEVGLFMRMYQTGIGQVRLKPITLSVNFRSTTAIVEWVNATFKTIFPPFNDIATGTVAYSPSVSNQDQPLVTKNHSVITIKGFLQISESVQADHIITLIKKIKTDRPQEKIAILVRARTHVMHIIPALKKAQLPFHAIDIDPLASQPIIHDLLSLTCALLHLADRIAWLAILRAPWCGLTLADLAVIANEPHTLIWPQLECSDITERLSKEGQQRLKQFIPIIKSKIIERQRDDLRYWIESTWLLLGGPACYHQAEQENAQAFFNLLSKLSQNSEGLDIEKLKNQVQYLFATTHQADDSLQIMTIHSAKGLEFDTVILPHLERKLPSDEKSLLAYLECPLSSHGNALLLAPIHRTGQDQDAIYRYIRFQHTLKSNHEIDRLFYVAVTRAKKCLYLFFSVDQHHSGYKIETNTFLQKIWPLIEKESKKIISLDESENPSAHPSTSKRLIKRLVAYWQNPIMGISIARQRDHQQKSGFHIPHNQSKLMGIMAHHLFRQLTKNGTRWWQAKSKMQQMDYLQQHLKQLGLLATDLLATTQLLYTITQNALNDPRGQWLLYPHQEAHSEWPVTAIIDGQVKNLVIDRTFIDTQGVRWIIDYKTTASWHGNVEFFLNTEQKKYHEKMYEYYQAMRSLDSHPICLGLYFPALPAWREWRIED